MNRNHDELLDDVAVYALGALPAADAARVRAHLLECPECAAEYVALSETTAALALAAQACPPGSDGIQVSALLKGRIMRDVRATLKPQAADGEVPRRSTSLWPAYLVAAACFAIALILSTISNISLNASLNQSQAQLATAQAMLADSVSPQARRIAIPGGTVIVRAGHLYITMRHLAAPPKGKVYQAWTLARGAKTVAPSLTFTPNAQGVAIVAVPADARKLAAVAVSVEPAGGSKTPTTKPIAFAALT
ncbi:MAG TPA: anti-sigma factor [Verrucomicrobiae bacterium]|jgi:anti-sigma-K factor RskA|nr:anti-sigma factor [Verrucomicrobiae bacterium]